MSDEKLRQMWDQQHEFMNLLVKERGFPQFPVDISTKDSQKFLTDIMHHCSDELLESRQHLKNGKSHRVTQIKEVDMDAYLEELIDAQHLLFEVVIASGFSIDQFFESYMAKGLVNEKRIKSGY